MDTETLRETAQHLAKLINKQSTVSDAALRSAYAEVLVLDSYGREPSAGDLVRATSKKNTFRTTDLSGRQVRIVTKVQPPYRVYTRFLDADVFVFVRTSSRSLADTSILGWLGRGQVEESVISKHPPRWEGGDEDFSFDIEPACLIPMPPTFDFEERCHHPFGIWDYVEKAWDCFWCGRFVIDRTTREIVARDAESEKRSEVSATEEGA